MATFRAVRSLIINGKPVAAGTEFEVSEDGGLEDLLAAGQIVSAEPEPIPNLDPAEPPEEPKD